MDDVEVTDCRVNNWLKREIKREIKEDQDEYMEQNIPLDILREIKREIKQEPEEYIEQDTPRKSRSSVPDRRGRERERDRYTESRKQRRDQKEIQAIRRLRTQFGRGGSGHSSSEVDDDIIPDIRKYTRSKTPIEEKCVKCGVALIDYRVYSAICTHVSCRTCRKQVFVKDPLVDGFYRCIKCKLVCNTVVKTMEYLGNRDLTRVYAQKIVGLRNEKCRDRSKCRISRCLYKHCRCRDYIY